MGLSTDSDWEMVQHDLHRTGFTNLTGNITTPAIKWVFSPEQGTHPDFNYCLIGDVTADGNQEIVVTSDNKAMVLNGNNGSLQWDMGYYHSDAALGDIDNDGIPEIITGDHFGIYAMNAVNQSTLWFKTPGTPREGTYGVPTIADIDNDGSMEIIVGTDSGLNKNGTLFSLNAIDGTDIWNITLPTHLPLSMSDLSKPAAIEDIDGDNEMERVVVDYNYDFLYVFNANGSLEWSQEYWGYVPPSIADVNNDGIFDIINHFTKGVIALDGINGNIIWSYQTDNLPYISYAVGDINGDATPDVVTCDGAGNVSVINGEDGSKIWGYKINDYVIRTPPLIADIDGDNELEIIASSYKDIVILSNSGNLKYNIPCRGNVNSLAFGDIDNDGYGELVFTVETNLDGYVVAVDFGKYPIPSTLDCGIMPESDYYVNYLDPKYSAETGDIIQFNISEAESLKIAGCLYDSNLQPGEECIFDWIQGSNIEITSDVGSPELSLMQLDGQDPSFMTNWTLPNITQNTTAHISVHAWKDGYQDAWWNVTVNIVGNFTNEANDQNQIPGFGFELILLASAISIAIVRIRRKKEN